MSDDSLANVLREVVAGTAVGEINLDASVRTEAT
jgi:hypothetical protein